MRTRTASINRSPAERPRRLLRSWLALMAACLPLAFVVGGPARADRGVFTKVVAFPIKTDFRVVVAWQTDRPIEAVVRYGSSPSQLTKTALPAGIPAAPSQMAFVDVDRGQGVYLAVEDVGTGEQTPIQHVVPRNSYRSYDKRASAYTVNLALWLDSEASPGASPDADLQLIAEGVNVMAERVYDALDGDVRIGKVLISDAPIGRTPHARTFQYDATACEESRTIGADVILMTAFPSSSETNGRWMIDDPCGAVFLGRLGPYGSIWQNELDLGGIMTHELMHYAFGLADQYPKPDGVGDGDADCINDLFDMSLMNKIPTYSGDRWTFTELDRNADDTPCDHGTVAWSWPTLITRYRKVSNPSPNVPAGIVDRLAKGNPDGGALEIWLLDHAPGRGAVLNPYAPEA